MSISRRTIAWTLGIVAALYLGLAYALAPWAWRHFEHQRGLADRPMITTTRFGIPGDALNVGLDAQVTHDPLTPGYATNLHETTTLTPVDPDEGVQAVAACCRFMRAYGRF